MCADRKKDIHSSVVISELSICWKTSSDTSANHTGSWSTCSSPSSSDRRSPTWRGGDTNPSICDIIFTLYFILLWSFLLNRTQLRFVFAPLTPSGLQLWWACWRRRLSGGSVDPGAWWTPSQPAGWAHTGGWWSGRCCRRVLHRCSVLHLPEQDDDTSGLNDQNSRLACSNLGLILWFYRLW